MELKVILTNLSNQDLKNKKRNGCTRQNSSLTANWYFFLFLSFLDHKYCPSKACKEENGDQPVCGGGI